MNSFTLIYIHYKVTNCITGRVFEIYFINYSNVNSRILEYNNKDKPSPGYAGVSLSLVKTELNARGLHTTDGLRLNPIIELAYQISAS